MSEGTETTAPPKTDSTIAMMTDAQMREPKSSVGVYELPCGFLDATGVLHSEVVLNEITGKDEDMLANDKIPSSQKMNQLLCSTIVRLGSITDRSAIAAAVPELLVGDRVFLLIAVRRVSLGDDYPYRDKCPNQECGVESLMNLDLSTLETVKMPFPTKRVYDGRMPSAAALRVWSNSGEVPEPEASNPTGRTVRFKMLSGRDVDQAGFKVKGKTKHEDAISALLSLRLELLDGKPPTISDLQSLSLRERLFLRDGMFRPVDGGVDTTLEVTCPVCMTDFERELDIMQTGFFFPSVARKNSKIKSST